MNALEVGAGPRVKPRRTQCEHMFSGFTLIADIDKASAMKRS
jgi:hypothetical protein